MATPNPTTARPTLGAHFISGDTYNPMGAAPIPASPEAWAPYPLYTMELIPAISHTARSTTQPPPLLLRSACSGALVQFSSVQLLNCVRLFVTPWTAALQASLSITNSRSLLKFMSIASMMPSNHLILYHPLLLLPSIFPSIRVFSQ